MCTAQRHRVSVPIRIPSFHLRGLIPEVTVCPSRDTGPSVGMLTKWGGNWEFSAILLLCDDPSPRSLMWSDFSSFFSPGKWGGQAFTYGLLLLFCWCQVTEYQYLQGLKSQRAFLAWMKNNCNVPHMLRFDSVRLCASKQIHMLPALLEHRDGWSWKWILRKGVQGEPTTSEPRGTFATFS